MTSNIMSISKLDIAQRNLAKWARGVPTQYAEEHI